MKASLLPTLTKGHSAIPHLSKGDLVHSCPLQNGSELLLWTLGVLDPLQEEAPDKPPLINGCWEFPPLIKGQILPMSEVSHLIQVYQYITPLTNIIIDLLHRRVTHVSHQPKILSILSLLTKWTSYLYPLTLGGGIFPFCWKETGARFSETPEF